MKDFGQNLQTFDDARPRAVEVLIALHGLQLAPARAALEQRHLLKRSRYVKAARVHEEDVRICENKLGAPPRHL
jgi:hypothetical protein